MNHAHREQFYPFDTSTRTWNGNLMGQKKKNGMPNMSCSENYSENHENAPKCGETYVLKDETIVWDGSRWCGSDGKPVELLRLRDHLLKCAMQPAPAREKTAASSAEADQLLQAAQSIFCVFFLLQILLPVAALCRVFVTL
jgi:hypothetical protein